MIQVPSLVQKLYGSTTSLILWRAKPMRKYMVKYVLPNGGIITLEHPDFGLYVVAYNEKPLREFYDSSKARVYLDKVIGTALNLASNRTYRKAA
jgi:hypothetical protein